MKKIFVLFSFSIGLILAASSCKKDPVVECGGTIYSYELNVQPLLNSSCNTTGCHVQGAVSGDFSSFEGVRTKVDNGSLKARILDGSMPENSSLTLSQKQVIVCWIENGALDN